MPGMIRFLASAACGAFLYGLALYAVGTRRRSLDDITDDEWAGLQEIAWGPGGKPVLTPIGEPGW